GRVAHADRLANRGCDQTGLGQVRQLDQPDSVLEIVEDVGGDALRQTRLARPPGPGERHRARLPEESSAFDLLALTSNKRAEVVRQVRRYPRRFDPGTTPGTFAHERTSSAA